MTETIQVLTPASVRAAARDYHARGMLTAQAPDPDQRWCKIEVEGRRCAIGAALNDETMARFRAAGGDALVPTGVTSLVELGFVKVDPTDISVVSDIQYRHDCWTNDARDGSSRVPAQEAAFLAAIQD